MAHRRTLSTLRTSVRNKLDEATASFWTNAQLLDYLNEAKDRVWTEVRKLKADYFLINRASTDGSLTILSESYEASSFQIVAGTREYTLPPDFFELRLIEVITSSYEQVRFVHRDLSDLDMRAAREVTDNQTPNLFYYDLVGERTLTIAPKSDTTLDLRLWYIPRLADLSGDSDTLEMPSPLDHAVVSYAVASAMLQDQNPLAATYEARAGAYIATAFGAHSRQSQDPEFVESYLHEWTGA